MVETTDTDGSDCDASGTDAPDELTGTVERGFTCTVCGYETVREVPLLRGSERGVCVNCGGWTVGNAREDALVEAAREAAAVLAGETLTERQALSYLLRDVVGVSRERTATAMDSSPSNVDNLQRRAREKLDDARRTVAGVETLVADATAEADTDDAGRSDA